MSAILFGLSLCATLGSAQSSAPTEAIVSGKGSRDVTLSGKVIDVTTGQPLERAVIYERIGLGLVRTDASGAFTIAVPPGDSVHLSVGRVDYGWIDYALALKGAPRTLEFALIPETAVEPAVAVAPAERDAGSSVTGPSSVAVPRAESAPVDTSIRFDAVVIAASSARYQVHESSLGLERLKAADVKLLASLLGEADVLRALQLRPGIPSGSEGSTGLYVRGGGTDQNLVLLDGATVYNPSHLFGMFGIFNADAVDAIDLYKGAFPARYGGRLSSVIDVGLRDGRRDRLGLSGGVGLLASRLTAEGPLGRRREDDKDVDAPGSWIVSGRRTYINLVTNTIERTREPAPRQRPIPDYYFGDVSARASYRLSARDRLSVSGFQGGDDFVYPGSYFNFGLRWVNTTAALRWQRIVGRRGSVNTSLTASDYAYSAENSVPGYGIKLGSGIRDYSLTSDALFELSAKHQVRFGVAATQHRFDVGRLRAGSTDGAISFSAGERLFGTELGLYVSDAIALSRRVHVLVGLRASGFVQTDTAYARLAPRASLNYRLNEQVGLKIGYARMYQYVHLVTTAGIALPTDIWYPSTRGVGPERSDQLGVGVSALVNDGLLLTAEAYSKRFTGLVDFIDGAQLFGNTNLESEFDFGRGDAYGLEVKAEKTSGRLLGWIGYTYQRNRRGEFARIMQGRYFRPRYDRRHDISVVGRYVLSPRWSLTATWVYGSGDLYWLPVGRAFVQGTPGTEVASITPIYGDRNNYRLRPYHRADVGAVLRLRPRWGASDLTFGLFNAYDRRNAFFVYVETTFETVTPPEGRPYEVPANLQAKQVSIFPILPSLTWNFTL